MSSSSTVDNSVALSELRELSGFLSHANPAVRVGSAKMVVSLSALESNRVLIAETPLVHSLARQMSDQKDMVREVYKSLINFAESEELLNQMLKANVISIAMEVLRDSKTDLELRELLLMLLTNMTRAEKGASVLMQEGEEVEGLHVRRLFGWFTAFVPTGNNASQLDPNAYAAHILTNISQLPVGRRLCMDKQRGFIAQLKPQFTSQSPIRRLGVLNLVKNCFMEDSHHATLLSDELGIWPLILQPIIGSEDFLHGESEYTGILPSVRSMMTPSKRRDPDPQVRVLVYEIILLCARHKPSRATLRSQAIYPILRHAHDAEKAAGPDCHELDDLLEQLVPFYILDEDSAEHPDAQAAEKKRQRMDQLKGINDREDDASANSESKSNAKEPVDQPVHYLGDELGGEVRRRAEQATRAPVAASSVAPASKASIELIEDEPFPDMEPLGAEETSQLGDVTHNIQSLALAQAANAAAAAQAKAAAAPPAQPAVVYAQAEADDEDDDGPPELADEDDFEAERHMNALD